MKNILKTYTIILQRFGDERDYNRENICRVIETSTVLCVSIAEGLVENGDCET